MGCFCCFPSQGAEPRWSGGEELLRAAISARLTGQFIAPFRHTMDSRITNHAVCWCKLYLDTTMFLNNLKYNYHPEDGVVEWLEKYHLATSLTNYSAPQTVTQGRGCGDESHGWAQGPQGGSTVSLAPASGGIPDWQRGTPPFLAISLAFMGAWEAQKSLQARVTHRASTSSTPLHLLAALRPKETLSRAWTGQAGGWSLIELKNLSSTLSRVLCARMFTRGHQGTCFSFAWGAPADPPAGGTWILTTQGRGDQLDAGLAALWP